MTQCIDARGRACPEPVILTKKALSSKQSSYEILVDNPTALGNVTRFANSAGYAVTTTPNGDDYRLLLTQK